MKYSIVIPTYNHCDDLLKPAIESIFQFSHLRDIELIISANGCFDNTAEYLSQLQKQFNSLGMEDHLKIIWHNEALGFSRATNAGIKAATQDLIILFSNDVRLLAQPKNNWLDRLSLPFETNPQCGITCSTKMYSEHAGREFAIFYCVMIHRKVFDKIGLLNEEYGVGSGEDIEFSIETEKAGFDVVQVSENRIDHDLKMWISDFPLYHKGEGTVHDSTLVQNWEGIFSNNMLKVAQKYNPDWIQQNMHRLPLETQSQLGSRVPAEKFQMLQSWNKTLYDEIFAINCYNVLDHEVQGKTILDLGAHNGTFGIFCLAKGAKEVYAVEANLITFAKFLQPLARGFDKMRIRHNAVAAHDGQTLYISNNDVSSTVGNTSQNSLSVESISLKTLVNQLEDRDLVLKIDIEGSEFDVILTSEESVLRRFETIYIEVHGDTHPQYPDISAIKDRLTECGFAKTFEIPLLWFGLDGKVTQTGVWNEKYTRINN